MVKKRTTSQVSTSKKKKQAVGQRPPSPSPWDKIVTKVAGRPLHQEKEFPKYPRCAFYKLATEKLGMKKLLEPRGPGNETFVRHFYAYCHHWSIASVQFRDVPANGVNLFTTTVIREFYDLPFIPDCRYSTMKDLPEDEYPLKEIADVLIKPGEERWIRPGSTQIYLRQACLNREGRFWLQFISYNVSPLSHRSNIPKETALLMYLMMTKQPVQLEKVIYDAVYHSIQSMRNNLIFPHLISDVFLRAGVPEEATDLHFQPVPPFKYDQVKRDKRPVDEFGEPITLSSLHSDLQSAEKQRERTDRRLKRVETILERLALKMEVEVPSEIESESENEEEQSEEISESEEAEVGDDPAPTGGCCATSRGT